MYQIQLKAVIPVKNGKSEHYILILHIRINLVTICQPKLTILFFFRPKNEFPIQNRKIALARASVVATYYIELFCSSVDSYNNILLSLLVLVAKTKISDFKVFYNIEDLLITSIWSHSKRHQEGLLDYVVLTFPS